MGLERLTWDKLGNLDHGIAGELVNRELAKAYHDIEDRGEEDGKPRKVVIEVEIVPSNGLVVATLKAQSKLPPYVSGGTACNLRREPGDKVSLLFQSNNPERPDQPTLEDFDPETGEMR